MKDTLIIDIETDSKDSETANLKWFGAYSYNEDKYYLLNYTKKEDIKQLIKDHKYIVGFNNISFDQPIIEHYFKEDMFSYKIILDLFQCFAPRGNKEYNKFNKNRLTSMGYILKNHKLKTIVEAIGLDNENKGDIDYDIFKKDKWNEEEIKEIKKYLKKDIIITKKLFEWYEEQFRPLKHFLNKEDQYKLKHLKSSIPSLAYQIICNKANLKLEWEKDKPDEIQSYSGGHHIEARWNLVKGNIIEIDFASAYPHAMMMCNLYSPSQEGWSGNGYFKVKGTYNNKEMGKVELAINEIFMERLKAKHAKNLAKNMSYKLIINAAYGLTGNYKFKSLYNKTTAGDCTSIVRTWMKKLAKMIEENGFSCLYGFTDSIFVKIPEHSSKDELMMVVDYFIKEVKNNVSFPLETFKMDVEAEIKLIWFISKNCYLFLTQDDKIIYKSTLLNKNTPKVVMNVFEDYIKPKIIKTIDIKFTKNELLTQIKKVLEKDISLVSEEYIVNDKNEYKVKTSLQYQISKKYGEGRYLLIPNKRKIGVGKDKSYCTIEEFNDKKLKINDIDLNKTMKWLEPFIKNNQKSLIQY
jgi:DNA polymerase elongation subunit (family B)